MNSSVTALIGLAALTDAYEKQSQGAVLAFWEKL